MIQAIVVYCIACASMPCLSLQFTDWPGLVRTHQGQPAALSWRLDTSLDNEEILFQYRQSDDVKVIYSKTPLDGEVIHPDYRGRVTAEYEDGNHRMTFTLSDMQQDDITGQYGCGVFLQGLNSENDNVTLFLYKIPEDTTISPDPATTIESDTFTLTCLATLTSSPASLRPGVGYTWTRNDGPLPARHRVEGPDGQRLVISPVHRDDNQQKYTCVAQETGSSFSGSTETRLDVQYGPVYATVTPTQVTAVEGDHVTLTCSSDCSPSCTYTWSRLNDDTFNHVGPVLSRHSIDSDAHDTYSCEATNSHGSKSASGNIHVNFGSEITDFSSSSGELFHEDAVVLMCSVDSRPTSTIVIIHNTTELSRSNDNNTSSYSFNSINILDSGNYKCEAGNSIGPRVSESIPLDIKGGFHFCDGQPNHSSHGLALNAMFQTTICQFANPFNVVSRDNWVFVTSNETLPDDVNITVIPTDHPYRKIINFYIPRISQTHYGTYTMTNGNGHGDDLVYSLELTPEGGGNTLLIVGAVLGVTAAVVIMVVIFVLWRKGKFTKQDTPQRNHDNCVSYDNRVGSDLAEEVSPYSSTSATIRVNTDNTEPDTMSPHGSTPATRHNAPKNSPTSDESKKDVYAEVKKDKNTDIYSEVKKDKNMTGKPSKPNIPREAETSGAISRPGPYSEVCIPGIATTNLSAAVYQNFDELKEALDIEDTRPFVGDDGITYARLSMMDEALLKASALNRSGAPPPPPIIRGSENNVDYAAIDCFKTQQQKK